MKKQFIGAAVAFLAAAVTSITASAGYELGTEQDGNTIKVEVVADHAMLPAIEFTVGLPDDAEAKDVHIADGAVYNDANGKFAWAGVEAPADGTVMYSATFTIVGSYEGEFTITPEEGYEEEMADALTTVIAVANDGTTGQTTGTSDNSKASSGTSGDAADANGTAEKSGLPVGGIVAAVVGVVVVIGGAIIFVLMKKKK